MHIESLALTNFRCFGASRTFISLDAELTAFIGSNGAGKTAACHALRRMFGISNADRVIEPSDFHVASGEPDDVASRSLRIEAILAFPELDGDDSDEGAKQTVPEFFRRMAANDDGTLKCRLMLEATWQADGTADGAVEVHYWVVQTFAETFTQEDCVALRAAERARIQMVYIPPSRDGARQVTAFLRGRLWRAARWSEELRELVGTSAGTISSQFHSEAPTEVIEEILRAQWEKLHGAGTHAKPVFQPLEPDVTTLLRGTELVFEPDHSAPNRTADALSDGQRSLLHLALTAATVEVEAALAAGSHPDAFDVTTANLPVLTLFVVEEPENSLAPFYLSRIVEQILALCKFSRAQGLLASHSASVLSRIEPTSVRHFRLDPNTAAATVRPIELPKDDTDAAKFIREAVHAHPELYFSRFVVLGEGDTEELVIPRIARARGVDLDPSFVAMVPLGGRHTNHFWRLLRGLDIPHATLIDLDYGRDGGGAGRLRTAFTVLDDAGVDAFDHLEGFDCVDDLDEDMTLDEMKPVVAHLRGLGVFFSGPLDLDMTMLERFPDAYRATEPGKTGPGKSDPFEAVLGSGGNDRANAYWRSEDTGELQKVSERLRWYRYLFLSRSKPSSHLRALSQLTDSELAAKAPASIDALVNYIQQKIAL